MGRPRTFKEPDALRAALFAFWEHGYEGTTLSVLEEATGLGRTSLYRTFGSKDDLFDAAVAAYHENFLTFRLEALAEPSPFKITEKLLRGMAALHNGEGRPSGCLETAAALSCAPANTNVRSKLASNRDLLLHALEVRFTECDAAGLPPGFTAKQTAGFVATVIMGMSVQARGGHGREEMDDVVDCALSIWGSAA